MMSVLLLKLVDLLFKLCNNLPELLDSILIDLTRRFELLNLFPQIQYHLI